MEQEEDIQSFTLGYLGVPKGPNSSAIDRILRHQGMRLSANIALLEQRYEMLPHPTRFQILQKKHGPLSSARRAANIGNAGMLPCLIAQHFDLLRKIETLMGQRPDGQRGELILAEIARNHEEMAQMLTALLKDDVSMRDLIPNAAPPAASSAPMRNEANWENEGGPSHTRLQAVTAGTNSLALSHVPASAPA